MYTSKQWMCGEYNADYISKVNGYHLFFHVSLNLFNACLSCSTGDVTSVLFVKFCYAFLAPQHT